MRKLARKQAIRDGLIVVKPKKRIADGAKRPAQGAAATARTISATE
jgi:hypothetical protein